MPEQRHDTWRVWIAPKVQPRGFGLVLMPSRGGVEPAPGCLAAVVIDEMENDPAGAYWKLYLRNGDTFTPPAPPPPDSEFCLIHERSGAYLMFPYDDGGPGGRMMIKERNSVQSMMDSQFALNRGLWFDSLGGPLLCLKNYRGEYVLDVAGARMEPNAPVVGWRWNGDDNQQWVMSYSGLT